MKIKTSELIGPALDWAVAKCEGAEFRKGSRDDLQVKFPEGQLMSVWTHWGYYLPSTDWAQGGPIIEREEIQLSSTPYSEGYWCYAQCMGQLQEYSGPTPLIAAMRCYVASRRGDEVEVPEELA